MNVAPQEIIVPCGNYDAAWIERTSADYSIDALQPDMLGSLNLLPDCEGGAEFFQGTGLSPIARKVVLAIAKALPLCFLADLRSSYGLFYFQALAEQAGGFVCRGGDIGCVNETRLTELCEEEAIRFDEIAALVCLEDRSRRERVADIRSYFSGKVSVV